MKKYRRYMNGVKAPDPLRQRLQELKAPEKRPVPWARYGSMAAALVLMCGLGTWGLGRGGWDALADHFPPAGTPEAADVGEPDIALEGPGDVTEPGEKTLGGYDVTIGSGSEARVAHYILPYIEYGETEGSVELDWDIPQGATRRDLTQDEIMALMGGEDALSTHLDWGEEYVLTGWGAWYEDGSFWGAYIDGIVPNYGAALNSFEFAVTAGQLPPTCYGYSGSVTQEIRGLTVTADKSDWENRFGEETASVHDRRVSFMKDDYGYRFEMSSGDPDMAEEMVSRLVCRIADVGLALTYDCPYCGHTFPFGAVHNDPAIGAEGGYTCPDCGVYIEPGMKHYHTQVDGEGAIPGFVPDYDPTYEDGVPEQDTPAYDPREAADPSYNAPAASEEICGYPLAPGGDSAPAISAEICGLPLNPGGDVATETIYD